MEGEGAARAGRARAGEAASRGEGEARGAGEEERASWEALALAISTTGREGGDLGGRSWRGRWRWRWM